MTDDVLEGDAPDPARRTALVKATAAAGGLGIAAAAYPFLASLAPSERAKALGAPAAVDIGRLPPGELMTVQWRGKPVWILRRTPDMLASLKEIEPELVDPDSERSSQQPQYARNRGRAIKPEYFVTVALCTHLGCVPSFVPERGAVEKGWPGGFYCPCHGSKFDFAGRVFKNVPAPTNLVIPPYRYSGASEILVGEDPA
ncbi:MAG: ubiquinol-cytochrome c reductase iron-sulfur subunit [Burkholderiales bacterium]|nr:ubiquinol-cytochrome c reductase iron-sulfur subunit [Burkholderiales bacterium]